MDLRNELEGRLPRKAVDAAWNYLVAEGHAATVEKGDQRIGWLADKAIRFLELADKTYLLKPPVQILPDDQRKRVSERHQVLAILWAKEAEADPDVVAFRKEVLRGRLLQVEDVEGWLEEHAKADGPGKSERGSQIQVLAYAIPADRWERCIPTAASRVLERLRQIVERLSERYRWQEAQATIFVLTGRTPLVPPAEAKIEREAIVLTVDPSLTPRQVANYYRQFKKEILGGGRIKALSLKHLQLAAFAANRPNEEPWAKKMEAWNRSVPKEWRYENGSYFKRDCLQAQRRLLAPLPPPERRFLRYVENQRADLEKAERSTKAKKRGEK
jgi:hypothetical protein